jgi:Tol biopolymer transport system component
MKGAIMRLRPCRRTWLLLLEALALIFFAGSLRAGSPQLVSRRDDAAPVSASGNDNSVAPWVSADGRFVLFVSSAGDLVPGDNSRSALDVFLRDRSSNSTVLVSAAFNGTGGGDGSSMYGGVSTNGRYVVFESEADDLVPGDTNEVSDIFLRDLVTGTTQLVSIATNGAPANGASTEPVMTPDGRYVAFVSAARNLVTGDTNLITDVFVRDLLAGSTVRVSVESSTNANLLVTSPLITPDGRYVAFCSNARGLAPGVPANTTGEIYLRDLVAGSTIWVSTNAAVIASNAVHALNNMPSTHPALSDDGRFVAFRTGSTNLTGSNGVSVVFQFDSMTRLTTLIATNGYSQWVQNEDVSGPEMTPDGRFIVFGQKEFNGSTVFSTVQLWDAQTGTNVLVSADGSGAVATNSISHTPSVSPDGRFVVFLSNATNLVGNVVSNGYHVYLRDVLSATTQVIDADTNGAALTDNDGTIPSLSADGRFVAFHSRDGGMVNGDRNGVCDVFVRDTIGGTNDLISRRDSGVVPAASVLSSIAQPSLSADGRWIAFASYADDLVPNDHNGAPDVFVRDLLAGTNLLVSVGANGDAALGGFSANPVISANGRYVAFVSSATNLVADNTNFFVNVFRRDLFTQTTMLVSVGSNGVGSADGDCSSAAISGDGRYVVYLTKAKNLAPGLGGIGANTVLRDIDAGTNVALSLNSGAVPPPPSISLDGHYVGYADFLNPTFRLLVWDTQLSRSIYTNAQASLSSMAISPVGTRLLYHAATTLSAADFSGRTNIVSFSKSAAIQSAQPWSTNGRFFAFVTASNAVAGDSNGTNDVYLYDLQNAQFTLVSVNSNHTGSANGPSDWPAVSGDGRFVIYRSFAGDIGTGVANPPPSLFIYDRFTGSNSLVTVGPTIAGWFPWVSRTGISVNGATTVFESWNAGLVADDLNRAPDVFAQVVDAAVDTDDDGIPDAWTLQYFGHATGQAGDQSRAQDDADGDGMTNLQEFMMSTDPTSAASVLRIQILYEIAGNNITLSWPAATGRNYRVQYKDNLTDPVWLDLPGTISVNGSVAQLTAPATQSGRYYRVSGSD